MKRIPLLAALALSACGMTPAQQTAIGQAGVQVASTIPYAAEAVQTGRLFCAVGPAVVALVSPAGAAILARGQTAAYVAQACAVLAGVPVPPPAAPVPAVVVAVR